MRIPESGPFEAPQDQTGQEKPFAGVMGRNHAPNPEHFSLFGQDRIIQRGEIYSLDEDTSGGILDPEDGISKREYPTASFDSTRPNYDEYDPYKPGNRERAIRSYGNVPRLTLSSTKES